MTRLAVFIFAISQNCFAQIANINTCLESSLHRVHTPVNSSNSPFRIFLSSPFLGTDLFESNFTYIPRKNTRLHAAFNGSPDYSTLSFTADQSIQVHSKWKLGLALGGLSQWTQLTTKDLPFWGGIQSQLFSEYQLGSQMRLSVSLEFDRIFLENSKRLDPVFNNPGSYSDPNPSPWITGQTVALTKKWGNGKSHSAPGITTQLLWKNQSDFQFFEVLGFVPLDQQWTLSWSLRNDFHRWGLGLYRGMQNGTVWGISMRYHRELQTFNAALNGSF
jgi:hypothetical protein